MFSGAWCCKLGPARKMLACAFVAAVLVVAARGCSFPPDHPSFSQSDNQNSVQPMLIDVLYVYTTEFGDCSGCVTELSVCYTPREAAPHRETILTIFIISSGNVITRTHNITVDPEADRSSGGRTNCRADGLAHPYCCVTQTLEPSEQFMVSSSSHYGMRTNSGVSAPLVHSSEQTPGYQLIPEPAAVVGSSVAYSSPVSIQKPMFYFSLTQGNSPPATPSPEPSVSTAADSIVPSRSTSTRETSTSTGSHATTSTPTATDSPESQGTTSTPTATNMGEEDNSPQSQGTSGSTALVGGVISVISGGALVVVLVLVVVLCVKRSRRKLVRQEGVTNVLFIAGGNSNNVNIPVNVIPTNTCISDMKDTEGYYTPMNAVPTNICTSDLKDTEGYYTPMNAVPTNTCISGLKNTEGYYTPMDAVPTNTHISDLKNAAVVHHVDDFQQRTDMQNSEQEESIYETPANSESALYQQFAKIRITNIPLSQIQVTELIDSGQFGNVNKGVWQSPSGAVEVAIKILKSSALQEDRVKFLQEGAIMGQFRHPNVVQLHGVVREGKTVLLVIELLAKTNLKKHLISLRPSPAGSEDFELPHTLLSYCRQVAYGMDYLSNKGFVHRDIAARNILISEDKETCKIADFGMSRDLADETYYISHGGKIPIKWTAPEALHYKKYSTASDVWSFGCLMYEIWSLGHKPFEEYRNINVFKMVDRGFHLPPPPGCP